MDRRTFLQLAAAAPRASFPGVYDVRTFGATGAGRTLDTHAIQKAIDAASSAGGGVVYFPPGKYLSGTLVLKSRVKLHLEAGAALCGSTNIADYNPRHLIYAKNVEDVVLEGQGTIDGQGDAFFDKDMKPLARPSPLIEIWDSRNIRILDLTIRNTPGWGIHPKNCDGVKIRGITLLNNLRAINSDGIDPDSCRNVIISDCHIEAGDDCIVLKTTSRGGAAGPTENVVVTNCVLVSAASALKLGTESHGDFRHCLFSNCVIRDSRTGIALFAKDGGLMEGVRFSNIVMTTQRKWGQGVEWPIVLDIEKRTAESRLSRIRDVSFSDITIHTQGRVLAAGMPESAIERLSFRNVHMRVTGYEKVEGVRKPRGGRVSAPAVNDYGSTPAALIFAHIRGLSVENLDLDWPDGPAEKRHAIFGDRLDGASFARIRAAASSAGMPAVHIIDSKNVKHEQGSYKEP
jgi:hypothetical protein